MRFAALMERTDSGWTAWLPAIPGVRVEAATAAAAEEDLATALQAHLRSRLLSAEIQAFPEVHAFSIEVRTRREDAPRRPLERQTDEEKRMTIHRLDAVLADGARLPSWFTNAVFRYRREVHDDLCEEDDGPAAAEHEGDENIVPFVPRER